MTCHSYCELSIAFYRLLLVTKSKFINKGYRRKVVLLLVSSGTCLAAAVNTVLFGAGTVYGRAIYNQCQGTTETFQVCSSCRGPVAQLVGRPSKVLDWRNSTDVGLNHTAA